ncbi:hypothetical protein E5288_WYG022159 [Bos mutus]|uniref:Uncharacterized protein n=1 Tax=Bos mutus TaxID=72004 RepID=A0A6B0RHQ0_9CETA|nr:hypothetical protein [Bos mutus]
MGLDLEFLSDGKMQQQHTLGLRRRVIRVKRPEEVRPFEGALRILPACWGPSSRLPQRFGRPPPERSLTLPLVCLFLGPFKKGNLGPLSVEAMSSELIVTGEGDNRFRGKEYLGCPESQDVRVDFFALCRLVVNHPVPSPYISSLVKPSSVPCVKRNGTWGMFVVDKPAMP